MKIPFFRSIYNKIAEFRSNLANPTAWLRNMIGGVESKSGVSVDEESAIKVSAVFACVKLISETVASLPLHILKKTEIEWEWQGKKIKRDGRTKATNHNLYELLQNLPNPETTAFDFWTMYICNLLLTGDAFAYLKRDASGKIVEIWNIPSKYVTKYRNKVTNEKFYKVRSEEGTEEAVYYPENIMHTQGMRIWSKDETLYPITLAREALGLSVALEEYASKYFANGANVGGIAEYEGGLGDEAFARFKNTFREQYNGVANSGKILFLENGLKFHKISNNPEESQSLESRKFQVIEIARFFNVPPHKIMELERSTNNNIEHQGIEFVQGCMTPLCVRIEQTIYKDCLTELERKKFYSKFSLNALLRGDSNARKEFYTAMITNGVYSPNDVRELEDINPYVGGDIYMVNGTFIPITMVGEQYAKGGENSGQDGKKNPDNNG